MRGSTENQGPQVVIDQVVVGDPANLPATHRAPFPEETELMAERGHAHPEHQSDIADAQVVGDRQQMQDSRARWVGEDPEQRRDGRSTVVTQGSTEDGPYAVRVQARNLASVGIDS